MKYIYTLMIAMISIGIYGQSTIKKVAPKVNSAYQRLSGTDIFISTQEEIATVSNPSNIKLMDSGIILNYLQKDITTADQLLSKYRKGVTFIDTTSITYGAYDATIYRSKVNGFRRSVDIWKAQVGREVYLIAFEYIRKDGQTKAKVDALINSIALDHKKVIPYQKHIPFTVDLTKGYEFSDTKIMGMHSIVTAGSTPMTANTILFSSSTSISDDEIANYKKVSQSNPSKTTVSKRGSAQILLKEEEAISEDISKKKFIIIDGNNYYDGTIICYDKSQEATLLNMVKSLKSK